jgi:hypothetical protein
MARGYHRLSFRARHLARQLGNAKNITLQRLHLHELRHAVSRKHGFRGPKGKPKLGQPGLYHRLTRKARDLLRRLRHSRSWQVQKQTITELDREVDRGERLALAKQHRMERLAARVERMADRVARAAARGQDRWDRVKPRLVRAARKAGVSTRDILRRAGRVTRGTAGRVRQRAVSWRAGRTRQQHPRRHPRTGPSRQPLPPRPVRGGPQVPRSRPLRTPRPAPQGTRTR